MSRCRAIDARAHDIVASLTKYLKPSRPPGLKSQTIELPQRQNLLTQSADYTLPQNNAAEASPPPRPRQRPMQNMIGRRRQHLDPSARFAVWFLSC